MPIGQPAHTIKVTFEEGGQPMRLTQQEQLYFATCAREILASDAVQSMRDFVQHGQISCLDHSLAVAYYSYWLCRRLHLRMDWRSLIRGALLHDFFLYDWHTAGLKHGLHGFTHPRTALRNARRHFPLNRREEDIIENHMWPLTIHRLPRCRETLAICVVDKWRSLAETFRLARPLPLP